MRMRLFSLIAVAAFALCLSRASAMDGSAYVGWGWNGVLPAVADANGVLVPYTPDTAIPPSGYEGEYFVEEFTDAKIKQLWADFKKNNPEQAEKMQRDMAEKDVNQQFRNTGAIDSRGKIDPHGDVDLRALRRPAFFGQAPYFEPIAMAESDAYTVEFTVPRDELEKTMGLNDPIKLRGWFLKGAGVPDGKGGKAHALVVLVPGYTIEIAATQHPNDPVYQYDYVSKQYKPVSYPRGMTERWGCGSWRDYYAQLHRAGFDVLAVDKRAHGMSGGNSPRNVGAVSDDVFAMLDQLESGNGLRLLTPEGDLLAGTDAAGKLTRGLAAKDIPVIIGGTSHGSMVASYVAQKNFIGGIDFGGDMQKTPPKGYNIKAVLLLASFAGGPGHIGNHQRNLTEGAYRNEFRLYYRPTSEVLADIGKWPAAVFIGKGLWDEHESAPGTFETYRRANGLKELVFVRGPHSENEFGAENVQYLKDKILAFCRDAIVNPNASRPEMQSFREAVLSSPDFWEPSSRPAGIKAR